MRIKGKKGQAAMEFLMTYGWAILAAIIAIGVLAYLGIFNPKPPSAATISAPFYANAWRVSPATVTVELRNNGGEDINVTNFNITNGKASGTSTPCNGSNLVGGFSTGTSNVFIVNCTGLSSGKSFRGDIVVEYRKSGSSVTLTNTGQISDVVATS